VIPKQAITTTLPEYSCKIHDYQWQFKAGQILCRVDKKNLLINFESEYTRSG